MKLAKKHFKNISILLLAFLSIALATIKQPQAWSCVSPLGYPCGSSGNASLCTSAGQNCGSCTWFGPWGSENVSMHCTH